MSTNVDSYLAKHGSLTAKYINQLNHSDVPPLSSIETMTTGAPTKLSKLNDTGFEDLQYDGK